MRVLPSILFGCLLLLAPGGCANRTVAKVKQMADRACACTDTACADKVNKEFWELAKTNQRGTRDERDEIQGHYNRMRECIGKLSPGTGATAGAGAKTEPAPATGAAAKTGAGQ
jgi:hypothetical protein